MKKSVDDSKLVNLFRILQTGSLSPTHTHTHTHTHAHTHKEKGTKFYSACWHFGCFAEYVMCTSVYQICFFEVQTFNFCIYSRISQCLNLTRWSTVVTVCTTCSSSVCLHGLCVWCVSQGTASISQWFLYVPPAAPQFACTVYVCYVCHKAQRVYPSGYCVYHLQLLT
jgi:hypothetical protein